MSRLRHYLNNTPTEQQNSAAIANLASLDHISVQSPTIAASIERELQDQRSNLKLIASENYSSLAVQQTMGNWLTDKYSEGFPYHRFYAGCDNVDQIESEATELLKQLFGADHAYVQPHSGADANLVAFWAILCTRIQNPEIERLGAKNIDSLSPEDFESIRQLMINQKLMGMSLNAGGHLTHGYRHNLSARMFQAVSYDVDPISEQLDYAAIAAQAKAEKPTILLAGYSAYPRRINFATMREIADSVGAVLMVDMAHFSGLVAGKVLQGDYNPIPFAHVVTSTTHKTLRGPRGGFVLCTEEFRESVDKGCPLALGGPLPHVMAAKAVAFREALNSDFQLYAQRIVDNAKALSEAFMELGARVSTGGTENHLVIVDVSHFGVTGRQAELVLTEANLTVNRNAIPFDKNGAWYTSGIRLGTPAVSTLGMDTSDMRTIAEAVIDVLKATEPTIVEKTGEPSKAKYRIADEVLVRSRARVRSLLDRYPLYPEIPDLAKKH